MSDLLSSIQTVPQAIVAVAIIVAVAWVFVTLLRERP